MWIQMETIIKYINNTLPESLKHCAYILSEIVAIALLNLGGTRKGEAMQMLISDSSHIWPRGPEPVVGFTRFAPTL